MKRLGSAAAIVAMGCVGELPLDEGNPQDAFSARQVSDLTVGGYYCPTSGEIAGRAVPANHLYYLTTFGGGGDTQRLACGGTADGRWLYIADSWRFGCGAKVRVTNPRTGRWCVTQSADIGPNICIERAAGRAVIDGSPALARELFGSPEFGWREHIEVRAEPVDRGTALGCGSGAIVDAGTPRDAGSPVDASLPRDAGSPVDVSVPRDVGTPTDPCAAQTNCAGCTALSSCGWCDGRCATGTSTGPTAGACASPWAWTSTQCVAPPVDASTPPVDAGTPRVDAGVTPVDAGTPPPVDAGTTALVRPAANATWHIDLEAPVSTTVAADWYDIDLFDNTAATIRTLHDRGVRVVCYFSAGSSEDWRPDFASFPTAALGRALDGWPGERWLDVRAAGVRAVMRGRLDLARSKGCDGVDPDNVDGYSNDNGFGLTASHQLDYNRWLAAEAHARGMVAGLKNDVEQIPSLVASFDFAVNEQCFEYSECDAVAAFSRAGRSVLHIEYGSIATNTRTVCPRTTALGFFSILSAVDRLDGTYTRCPR